MNDNNEFLYHSLDEESEGWYLIRNGIEVFYLGMTEAYAKYKMSMVPTNLSDQGLHALRDGDVILGANLGHAPTQFGKPITVPREQKKLAEEFLVILPAIKRSDYGMLYAYKDGQQLGDN